MNSIDGHVFLGNSKYMKQNPDELISEMDRFGVSASVVVAPPPGPFYEEANKFVADSALRFQNRLIPLFRVNPLLEGELDRIREVLDEGVFKGIQLDPTNDGYGVGNSVMDPIAEIAAEKRSPVYIHSGDSIFCPPEAVTDFADKFEGVNFVTNYSMRAPRAAKNCRNLYLMTYPFPTIAFQRGRAEDFDLDRLIFSSDSPLNSLELELKRVELAHLEKENSEKILGGNLRRIIKVE
jgi:predicted TIM-barrel fold metal-dependent hydrolase